MTMSSSHSHSIPRAAVTSACGACRVCVVVAVDTRGLKSPPAPCRTGCGRVVWSSTHPVVCRRPSLLTRPLHGLTFACRYDPSYDEEFSQSFASLAWPRASASAASLWNFQASLDPTTQQYADLIANHNARLTARGSITCPNGCNCDWNSKYGGRGCRPHAGTVTPVVEHVSIVRVRSRLCVGAHVIQPLPYRIC